MWPRFHRDVTEISPRCHRDVTEMRNRRSLDATGTAAHSAPRYHRDMTEMSPRCHRDVTEMSTTGTAAHSARRAARSSRMRGRRACSATTTTRAVSELMAQTDCGSSARRRALSGDGGPRAPLLPADRLHALRTHIYMPPSTSVKHGCLSQLGGSWPLAAEGRFGATGLRFSTRKLKPLQEGCTLRCR